MVTPLTIIGLDDRLLTALDGVTESLAVVALNTAPVSGLRAINSHVLYRIAVATAEDLGHRTLA
jgi:hypothetical protein